MNNVLGVDVGGTKILIGMVQPDGTILHERRYASRRGTQEIAVHAVEQAISAYWSELIASEKIPRPDAIGIGLVGQVDPVHAVWQYSLATPIRTPYPIGQILFDRFHVPVYADNDVHCATLAEMTFGEGRLFRDFVYLNVGTGIAAGLVSGGRLIRGHQNNAGEVGHIATPVPIPCPCGRMGCAETFASGGGLIRHARSLFEKYPDSALIPLDASGQLVSSTILQAARQGDALAQHVTDLFLTAQLSIIQDIINILDPQAIIAGGGVFRDAWVLAEITARLAQWLPANNRALLEHISISLLDPQKVGLIGAALLSC